MKLISSLLISTLVSIVSSQDDVIPFLQRLAVSLLPQNLAGNLIETASLGVSAGLGATASNVNEAANNIFLSGANTDLGNIFQNLPNINQTFPNSGLLTLFNSIVHLIPNPLETLFPTEQPFLPPDTKPEKLYDYIIIGGGTAGCVIAHTLATAFPKKSILVLERGRDRTEKSFNQLLLGSAILDTEISEEYFTPQGVRLNVANVIGGATSINGGLYIRETDDWLEKLYNETNQVLNRTLVNESYDWLENESGLLADNELGRYGKVRLQANTEAGFSPLNNSTKIERVTPGTWGTKTLFRKNRRKAADELLYTLPNIEVRLFTEVERIIFSNNSTSDILTYINNNNELTDPEVDAECVLIKDSRSPGGSQASPTVTSPLGVMTGLLTSLNISPGLKQECINKSGRIILSAGSILSPTVLMKSGIGPENEVRKYKRNRTILNNPEVGNNLSDHMAFGFLGFWNGYYNDTSIQQVYSTGIGGKNCTRIPDGATNVAPDGEGCNFFILEELSGGQMSAHYLVATLQRLAKNNPTPFITDFVNSFRDCVIKSTCDPIFQPYYKCLNNGVAFSAFLTQPKSRGKVTMNEYGKPLVDPGYLSNEEDIKVVRSEVRQLIRTFNSEAARSVLQREGASCVDLLNDLFYNRITGLFIGYSKKTTDLQLTPPHTIGGIRNENDRPAVMPPVPLDPDDKTIDDLHNTHYGTIWHYVGTNAMGKVVDQNNYFNVYNTSRLSICDASVLPIVSRVNSMGVTLMIGRYCAQQIIKEANILSSIFSTGGLADAVEQIAKTVSNSTLNVIDSTKIINAPKDIAQLDAINSIPQVLTDSIQAIGTATIGQDGVINSLTKGIVNAVPDLLNNVTSIIAPNGDTVQAAQKPRILIADESETSEFSVDSSGAYYEVEARSRQQVSAQ